MVEEVPEVGVAEQKLPKPCVGYTAASSGSASARRRTERYWARVSCSVCSGLIRSVRPTAPYSMDPPVNTATGSCPSWLSTKDRWPGVCPGVCMTVTVSDPEVIWSWSRTARRWKLTSSDAATTYSAPTWLASAKPPVT